MRNIEEMGFYYPNAVKHRSPPSEAQLAQTESRIKMPLPQDYLDFISKQNGGCPKLNYVVFGPNEYDYFCIEVINYIDGKMEDIYDVESASEWPSEQLNEQVVAIADDGSGDQLILRHQEGNWKVQWWVHDEEKVVHIANSFEELLNLLHENPPSAD